MDTKLWPRNSRKISHRPRLHDTPSSPRLPLSFLSWAYVRQGVYFLGVW